MALSTPCAVFGSVHHCELMTPSIAAAATTMSSGFIGAVMGMCHMWTAAWMNSCDEFVKKKDPDDRMEIVERGASLFRGAMTVFDGCHGSHSTTSNVHQFSKQFLPT